MDVRLSEEQRRRVEEFRSRHRTGVLTLLFTDMVGATDLKTELGDAVGTALIDQQQGIVRELLGDFAEAQEIKTAGDSFFIVFIRPSDAVRFSLLLHVRLRQASESSSHPILVRVGIHLGEVFIERHGDSASVRDILGLQVDTAHRIMTLAVGSQTLMSRGVFDNARAVLRGEGIGDIQSLTWMAHGPYRLKGVEEPLAICEVGEEGLAPFRAPETGEKTQRLGTEDEIEGWRPGLGVGVPGTNWVLEDKLGAGGFGEVWLAQDKSVETRKTVFKFCTRRSKIKSLRRELSVFNRLTEETGRTPPGVIEVRGAHDDGPPYHIELEFARGGDLRQWIEREGAAAPLRIRLDLAIQMARALAVVHAGGFIHRDIKPANYLVEPAEDPSRAPTLKLSDFGIGQAAFDDALGEARKTMTALHSATLGQAAGTYAFIAPELLHSTSSPGKIAKRAEAVSDLYSLGVSLYQLLAGDGEAIPGPGLRAVEDPILREDIIACLDEEPERRPSAEELADRLAQHDTRLAALQEQERRVLDRQRRRAQRTLALVGAALALVVVFGGISYWQFRLASAARDEAFMARADAEGLIEFMLTDLREKLEPVGRVDALEDVVQRAHEYYESQTEKSLDPNAARNHGVALRHLGRVQQAMGNFEEAHREWEEARRILEALSEEHPQDIEAQRVLADTLTDIGNLLLRVREDQRALETFEVGLAIRQRLAQAHTERSDLQRDLSDSLLDIGAALRGVGELDRALEATETGHEIRERLAAERPDDAETLRDLSVSHYYLGRVHQVRGELDQAVEQFRASLEIRQRLLEDDPQNTRWMEDVAFAHKYLGRTLRRMGDGSGALESFHAALAQWQGLVDHDPGNRQWRERLSVIHNHIGGLCAEMGNLDQALEHFLLALAGYEVLDLQGAENIGWRFFFKPDLENLVALSRDFLERGDADAALQALREHVACAERLAERHPEYTELRRVLATARNPIGDILRDRGDLEGALENYSASLALLESLVSEDPSTENLAAKSLTVSRIAHVNTALGGEESAQEATAETLGILEEIERRLQGTVRKLNPTLVHAQAVSLMHLGHVDQARRHVETLLENEWDDPEFLRLCRENGLLPEEAGASTR